MYIIGLTGGIASGKSTVAGMLRDLGAAVVDADQVSRALTASGGEALPAIREAFGDSVFDGRKLNRRALADRIFADETARQKLNGLMHPRIFAGVQAELHALAKAGIPVAVVDMPLLVDAGFDRYVDALWVCTLPEDLQLSRLMARNGLPRDEALARLRSQQSTARLAAHADVRIDTGGDLAEVRAQVERTWATVQQQIATPKANTKE